MNNALKRQKSRIKPPKVWRGNDVFISSLPGITGFKLDKNKISYQCKKCVYMRFKFI